MRFGKKTAVFRTQVIREPALLAAVSWLFYIIEDRMLFFQTAFTHKKNGSAMLTEAVIAVESRTVTVAFGHVFIERIVDK